MWSLIPSSEHKVLVQAEMRNMGAQTTICNYSPLGARLSMSPARKEISSSDAAEKLYSALATTWSSSPLAQLVAA